MKNKIVLAICVLFLSCGAVFVERVFSQDYSAQEGMGQVNMSPEDSLIFYDEVLRQDPDNYVALTALGDLYANYRADIHKSIKFYERAIKINDKYDLAHLGLAIDYTSLKMYDEAKVEFQKALMVSKRAYVQEAARQALINLGE